MNASDQINFIFNLRLALTSQQQRSDAAVGLDCWMLKRYDPLQELTLIAYSDTAQYSRLQ
eukprot:scaffold2267_cov187-Ochromonas_danica.AAC.4